MISFHKYNNEIRTAAHEHLIEGAEYAQSNNIVNIHFTLSPEHQTKFDDLMKKIVPDTEQKYGIKINITTSKTASHQHRKRLSRKPTNSSIIITKC